MGGGVVVFFDDTIRSAGVGSLNADHYTPPYSLFFPFLGGLQVGPAAPAALSTPPVGVLADTSEASTAFDAADTSDASAIVDEDKAAEDNEPHVSADEAVCSRNAQGGRA